MSIFDVPKSVVLLLSGGLDSSTLLAVIRSERSAGDVRCVTFDYGQRHRKTEAMQAAMMADCYQVQHDVYELKNIFTTSPLIEVSREGIPLGEDPFRKGMAPTYVPRRNTVLLALASALAEQWGFQGVAYGAHKTDSNYPDCTYSFAKAFDELLREGSPPEKPMNLYAPFISLTKDQIVRLAAGHRVPVTLTQSCYQGSDPACGVCDACQIRIEAFKRAGFVDPIDYAVDIDWSNTSPFPEDVNL